MKKDYPKREDRPGTPAYGVREPDAEPEEGLVPLSILGTWVFHRPSTPVRIGVRPNQPSSTFDLLPDDDPLGLGEPLSPEVLSAAANAVTAEPEEDPERFVREFVEKRREIAPEWDPAKAYFGDGKRSFADLWNAEPRDYEALAQVIRHHIARAR